MRGSNLMIGLVALASVSLAGTVNAEPTAAVTTGSINVPPSVTADCRADVARLCGAVPPGNGRIIHCLADNRSRLGKSCSAFLSRAEQTLKR